MYQIKYTVNIINTDVSIKIKFKNAKSTSNFKKINLSIFKIKKKNL